MPGFDDRNKDQTRDNLFGADAGPKAEQGSAKMAGGGQGDNNAEKNEQSLDQANVPQGNWRQETAKNVAQNAEQKYSTSYADFIKSIEKEYQQKKEQIQEQKQEQVETQKHEHKH
jgi:hypothetical protein